jgi:hypothetical protein
MSDTNPTPIHGATPGAVKHLAPDAVKHTARSAVKHDPGTYGPRFQLAEADAQRMAQLSAEVTAHLDEMAQIFASTTNVALDGMSPRYVADAPQADRAEVTYVEIVCGPDGCGCYVTLSDGTGWCEFPCGG